MLIKATSETDAEKKLLKSFNRYETPYLNSDGQLVRWKFERFADCYETNIETLNAISYENGVEVFSILKARRLRNKNIWNGKN